MKTHCDVVIIGSGPYGLSLAAHMRARGLDFRVFGKPMDSWRAHMPEDMMLKSDGFASNLSAPAPDSTLKAYCVKRDLPYADQALPIPLHRFNDYAQSFRERFVPDLDERMVASVERDGGVFALTLDDGERFTADKVVLAVGITWYTYTPGVLAPLSSDLLSHSFAHRDFTKFTGREVAIIGAGASAINAAHSLQLAGATPHIVARRGSLEYNPDPDPDAERFFNRIQRPASGIGRGWRSFFCAYAPLMFHRLPRHLKDRAISSHMHPAGGWFMRNFVEGKVARTVSRTVAGAAIKDGRAVLTLAGPRGQNEKMVFDHVIAATGYHPDLRRLHFLAPGLAERAAPGGGSPDVDENFETEVPGLYAVGLTAMTSFGPLMRFMYGANFAAPRLAAHFERSAADIASRRRAA